MANTETVTVGDKDFSIRAEQPRYLGIGNRVLATHSSLGRMEVVGTILGFHSHSYGSYARLEVESPPEHEGKIVHIYSGKVLE